MLLDGIMKDNQVALPSDIGEGYFRYISPCPNIEMYICDVMFYRDTVLREQVYKDSFSVIFSLSDALEWKSSGRNQKTLLEKGDCCVYGSGLFDAENIYEAGRRYIGVGLNLHPCRFRSVMDGTFLGNLGNALDELLSLHGIYLTHSGKMLRCKGRNTDRKSVV